MTATSVPRNRLLAQSDREFDLWQACREFAEKSSKIVPLGAPLQSCTVRRDPLQNVPKTIGNTFGPIRASIRISETR